MIWSLIAVLVIVSAYAAYVSIQLARLVRVNHEAEPKKPSYEDANQAIIEVIRCSLIDRPDEWEFVDDVLTHKSGAKVTSDGRTVTIEYDGARTVAIGRLATSLIEAAQMRNAKALMNALR